MNPNSLPVELSIVIPVYGCAECMRGLRDRVKVAAQEVTDSYEIILVDDCDNRGSWQVCAALAKEDSTIRAYRLSRNFGQHAAITAGLGQCNGRWAVVMDCDLQDPPETIPLLYRKAKEGYDVVLARRKVTRHVMYRRAGSRMYFKLMKFFNSTPLDGEFGSFSIISRKVVDAFLRFQDRDRHYLLILLWVGFRSSSIDYEHAPRHAGSSSYNFAKLVKHALDGIFFQTTTLLRWIVYLGFWVSCAGFVLTAYYIYMYLAHSIYPGFTSLAVLILVIGGFIIMSTGVTGLYIGKVFDQVKGRPLYVIDEEIVGGKSN